MFNSRRTLVLAALAMSAVAVVAYPAAARVRISHPPKTTWYYESKPWVAREMEMEGGSGARGVATYNRFMVEDLTKLLEAEGKDGWELASTPLESPRFKDNPRSAEKVWVLFKRSDAP